MVRKLAGVLAALVVAAAALVAFQYQQGREATPLRPGDTIPDVELKAVEGGTPARLRANLGPAAVIVFLDTRWPSTTRYAENLERVNRRLQRRGFRVVAIALDDSAVVWRDFIQRNAITFTVLHDPGGRATRPGWGTVSGPVAYLVDGSGRVVSGHPTPVNWIAEENLRRIEPFLPPPPAGWH